MHKAMARSSNFVVVSRSHEQSLGRNVLSSFELRLSPLRVDTVLLLLQRSDVVFGR